jgi:hypothetical protein
MLRDLLCRAFGLHPQHRDASESCSVEWDRELHGYLVNCKRGALVGKH